MSGIRVAKYSDREYRILNIVVVFTLKTYFKQFDKVEQNGN